MPRSGPDPIPFPLPSPRRRAPAPRSDLRTQVDLGEDDANRRLKEALEKILRVARDDRARHAGSSPAERYKACFRALEAVSDLCERMVDDIDERTRNRRI